MTHLLKTTALMLLLMLAGQSARAQALRAVLVVGHLEERMADVISEMDKVATFFTKKKVKVLKFYDNDANWEDIKKAAANAHFFVYSGHGSTMGGKGRAGGLCITQMIDARQILTELKLQPEALVILQLVCYAAGSSSGDDGDIKLPTARKRVADYAYPFLRGGAGAYFAINASDGAHNFLENFFDGNTLQQGFEKALAGFYKKECIEPYIYRRQYQIGIASYDLGGTTIRTSYTNGKKTVETIPLYKQYSIAFVGPADYQIGNITQKRKSNVK